MSQKSKNVAPALEMHNTATSPLVKPEQVEAGAKPDEKSKAELNRNVSTSMNSLASLLSEKAAEDKARLLAEAECNAAVAEYFEAVDASKDTQADWQGANAKIEQAAAHVSRAFADAILAGAFDRSTARRKLGEKFGFEVSPTTGKQTSKPSEPGNTIAKRVSSVTIAAEYAMTGILPDRGGDSLATLGQEKVAELLKDYFEAPEGAEPITVRAASQRIEEAIREARETVPLELSPDKIKSLAGKIETAAEKIKADPELVAQYTALLNVLVRMDGWTFGSASETELVFVRPAA